jgi:hypothetical protein
MEIYIKYHSQLGLWCPSCNHITPESLGMILSHLESHSGEDSFTDYDSLAEEVDNHADHVRRFLEEEHEDH